MCKIFKITPDYSHRPHQTLKELFKSRDVMAHGKTEILNITKDVSSQDEPYKHEPKTDWEKYCPLKNAKKAKEDIAKIITELHKKAFFEDDPFLYPASRGSISMKKSEK